MSNSGRDINEKGVVLISALLFMAIITIAGTSAYFASSNELQISGNYKRLKQSFYDAEAGVAYTLAVIENDLASGNDLTDDPEPISSYSAPTGYSFTPVTALTQVSANRYQFQVTGNTEGGASTSLEIVIERDSKMPYGLFGDTKLEICKKVKVFSYDSNDAPPTPSDTNKADIGSNGEVIINHKTEIDGNIDLGNAPDDGPEAKFTKNDRPIGYGKVKDVNRVDPDPLGAKGGDLETVFNGYASALKDNNDADDDLAGIPEFTIDESSGISELNISGGTVSLTGDPSREKNYYFTDVTVNSGTLNINANDGPVNIYLSGPLDVADGADFNITGPTTNVNIYSDSTGGLIRLGDDAEFKGLLYAPYSDIDIWIESDIHGLIWGNNVTFNYEYGMNFYYDMAISNNLLGNTVSVMSWKDMRYE